MSDLELLTEWQTCVDRAVKAGLSRADAQRIVTLNFSRIYRKAKR